MINAHRPTSCKLTLRDLTVVVCTCNRKDLFIRALDSIFACSGLSPSVIVVDDSLCGMKYAREVIESDIKYAPYSILVIDTIGSIGSQKSRNLGLTLTRTVLIGFLDDDDYYFPASLESLLPSLNTGNSRVAYGNALRPVSPSTDISDNECITIGFPFYPSDLYTRNPIPFSAAIAFTEDLIRIGGFDIELCSHQDWDLWIRLSEAYNQCPNLFHFVGKHVSFISNSLNSISNQPHSRTRLSAFTQKHFLRSFYCQPLRTLYRLLPSLRISL